LVSFAGHFEKKVFRMKIQKIWNLCQSSSFPVKTESLKQRRHEKDVEKEVPPSL
jgi:hypothetical protein